MKYTDQRAALTERDQLKTKKRLGAKQKLRLATLSAQLAKQPPTPARVATGVDPNGQSRADHDGSFWRGRLNAGAASERMLRRNSRFGRYGIKPMRSRIQRTRRKRRTGGVK